MRYTLRAALDGEADEVRRAMLSLIPGPVSGRPVVGVRLGGGPAGPCPEPVRVPSIRLDTPRELIP